MIHKVIRGVLLGAVLLLAGCGAEDITGTEQEKQVEKKSDKKQKLSGYTWMTLQLPWEGVVDLPFLGNPHQKESEVKPLELDKNSRYTLYLALGSVEYRVYNVVRIESSGRVVAAYKDPESWLEYQREFTVSREQIAGLTKVLLKNNVGDLPASAISSGEESLLQGGLTIVSGGRKRRSYFSDAWLKQFKNIVSYVNANILKYNPRLADNGYRQVEENMLDADPEATKAVRGQIVDR